MKYLVIREDGSIQSYEWKSIPEEELKYVEEGYGDIFKFEDGTFYNLYVESSEEEDERDLGPMIGPTTTYNYYWERIPCE